ncbi:MAG: 16S rRNA (adenine(1518)-N(6)/adenine(1519)-N(6))-dimethyltransferase RsmA [Clostridiales bacterium]|nr:16S rRNA (adenine(1518)-N(6)/adenine(1519)-N(6))-dimethyltransferase RsmA [Clostridiales bacterium]
MNNKLSSSNRIREIMKQYRFRFTKSLGQNFLKDDNVVDDIIEQCELTKDDVVIEIGPGIGVMTERIAEKAKSVIAVEIDKNLIPILTETLSEYNNIIIINEDILKINLDELKEKYFPNQSPKIIANLPYYITTPIIMKFLESNFDFESMIVMMQKEVAERIVSKPGNKIYGTISVAVQYYAKATQVLEVPKGAFVPEPNISSSVLKLIPHKDSLVNVIDHKMFLRTVKGAFSTRRKTLLNALSNEFDKNNVRKALELSGINPSERGEKLSVKEFAKLSNAFIEVEKSSK